MLMDSISLREALSAMRIVSGQFKPGCLTLGVVARDEIYFIEALLQHYRGLGVNQFAVLDDHSIDGTREFLTGQPDCIVLEWDFTFGQRVVVVDAPWGDEPTRAGVIARDLIPRRIGLDGWFINVDADEFLILPPGFGRLQDLLPILDGLGIETVKAVLHEMYPLEIWPDDPKVQPIDAAELFEQFGYFDRDQVFDGKKPSRSASTRLFQAAGVGEQFAGVLPPNRLFRWMFKRPPRTPSHKSPLVRWTAGTYLQGSHHGYAQPSADLKLAIAHFKFTPDLDRRTAMALQLRSYARASQSYGHYELLLERMRARGLRFAGNSTARFERPEDFYSIGSGHVSARFSPPFTAQDAPGNKD
jgi:hypothetical protein